MNARIRKLEAMQRLHTTLLPIIWVAIAYLLLAHLTGCAACICVQVYVQTERTNTVDIGGGCSEKDNVACA